jgi:ABC-type thiamin/hydroxymethylpyrimidine transport system permease subunit
VTRLDGVKMIAIAGVAAMIAAARTPGPLVSGWLRVVTVPLALALIASGYAYLTLTHPLAWTAFVSGLLLLLWVTGAGIATTIRHRHGSEG